MKKNTKKTKKPTNRTKQLKKKTVVKKEILPPKNWKPLRELALHTPYTMGYLSLIARRNQLKVKKFGRIWYSTMANIKDFEEKMKKQKEERNASLRNKYKEKVYPGVSSAAEKVNISVMDDKKAEEILDNVEQESKKESLDGVYPEQSRRARDDKESQVTSYKLQVTGDSIFDEVQDELQEILNEVRNKEKKLRHNYMIYRGKNGRDTISSIDMQIKKGNTEQISEKLISDVGKLLKTVNEIQNIAEEKTSLPIQDDNFKKLAERGHLLGNHHKSNFLSVPYSYFPFEDTKSVPQNVPTHSKILLFLAGAMVFVAAVLLTLVIFGQ